MRSYVRYAAAACAASLLVFAACSGDNAATPSSPDLSSGSLNYTITPAQVSWTRLPDGPMPVETKQVLIGGLIAVGGYPQFGAMQYQGATDWLEMTTTPDLSRSPLAWRFTFKLKPKAATLPIGRYTATIPVFVPAAQNNPQTIVVVFNHCDNCLFVGDERVSEMTGSAPTWNRGANLDAPGGYRYEDWRVFIPPFTSVRVDMFGGSCDSYTLGDPYLYAFGPSPATTFVTSNDDAGCGLNSIIYLFNMTGSQQEYLVRATNFSSGNGGTYKIRVSLYDDDYDYYTLRAPEPGDKVTAEAAGRRP